MDRIWHPYYLWEDYKSGFYKSETDLNKDEQIEVSKKLFQDKKEFNTVLRKIIKDWKYSCEHNLTNESLNKIAWLGQAACAYKYKISNDISREGYNLLNKEEKLEADKIAEKVLKRWESEYLLNETYKNGQMYIFEVNKWQ